MHTPWYTVAGGLLVGALVIAFIFTSWVPAIGIAVAVGLMLLAFVFIGGAERLTQQPGDDVERPASTHQGTVAKDAGGPAARPS